MRSWQLWAVGRSGPHRHEGQQVHGEVRWLTHWRHLVDHCLLHRRRLLGVEAVAAHAGASAGAGWPAPLW